MSQYTEEIHAKRLLEMLKMLEMSDSKTLRFYCPAQVNFQAYGHFIKEAEQLSSKSGQRVACEICRDFINWKKSTGCPCPILGEEKALKRTLKALKRKGYILTIK